MNNTLVTVLVVVVIGLVGWLAYKQGYLTGTADDKSDIEINLPGRSATPRPY